MCRLLAHSTRQGLCIDHVQKTFPDVAGIAEQADESSHNMMQKLRMIHTLVHDYQEIAEFTYALMPF